MLINSGVNKVILLGHVTSDEFLIDADYASLRLVTTEMIRKGNETITHHEYHAIKVPHKLLLQDKLELEEAQHLYIEGRIHTSSYVDSIKIKRYKLEVIASKIEIVSVAIVKDANLQLN